MVTATASKSWLVQKYGGTSLGKLLDTICCNIIPQYAMGHSLIVVCSAFSGSLKASGTTSLLLQCISYAELGVDAQKRLIEMVDLIKDNHLNVLEAFASSPTRVATCSQIYEDTVSGIKKECENLKRFLLAAQVSLYQQFCKGTTRPDSFTSDCWRIVTTVQGSRYIFRRKTSMHDCRSMSDEYS